MIDETNTLESVLPVTEPTPPRGHSLLAWVLIIGLVVFSVVMARRRSEQKGEHEVEVETDTLIEMQARMLVGAEALAEQEKDTGPARQMIAGQITGLDTGPVSQRLRYIVLVGELDGPEKALDGIKHLQEVLAHYHVELTSDQARTLDTLKQLYLSYQKGEYETPLASPSDRAFLVDHLGWFGSLALAPKESPAKAAREAVLGPAKRLTLALGIGGAAVVALAIAGVFGLVFILFFQMAPRAALENRAPLPYAGVYTETFALWLALFWVLVAAASYLPAAGGSLLARELWLCLSLVALAWPVLRGISWRQVRADIGLKFGARPLREVLLGFVCYVISLPFLAVGIAIVVLLLNLQGLLSGGPSADGEFSSRMPTHPILGLAAGSGPWQMVEIFLVASVLAPIMEETVFRGVLYGGLRGSTRRFGYWFSIVLSATLVSLIFAIIHPQGVVAVPGLMAVAFGLTLAREWRGSLVPGMVAHGINNGLIMALMLLGASG